MLVIEYLKETGDYDFLEEEITYYDKKVALKDRKKGTVLEHLKRSLEFTKNNCGQHGLPMLGFADWNDTVNLPGDAESVFNANLYGKALIELSELLDFLGDSELANEYRKDHAHMKKVVNDHCWDGDWYLRYFEDNGNAIGSKENCNGCCFNVVGGRCET